MAFLQPSLHSRRRRPKRASDGLAAQDRRCGLCLRLWSLRSARFRLPQSRARQQHVSVHSAVRDCSVCMKHPRARRRPDGEDATGSRAAASRSAAPPLRALLLSSSSRCLPVHTRSRVVFAPSRWAPHLLSWHRRRRHLQSALAVALSWRAPHVWRTCGPCATVEAA